MRVTPNALSEVAPTLAALKKLPMEQKCRLLLARLAKIGEHDSALNKHNLMMPGDPYALADGYPDTEKMVVREHLIGAPWTRLVNEGYLVDLTGRGFYRLSEEGKEYLDQEDPPAPTSPTSARILKSATDAPRAFLSYSWDDERHKQWVTELAARLQGEGGVEIIFDRWHLIPGTDKLRFMERGVADCGFVIVVCTPTYAERANNRTGGVGYESMVITSDIAEHMSTNKFIPVLRRGTWTSSLPIYLKSRMGVNLGGEPYDEGEYEKLLRALYKEPVQPPPLGSKPDFSKKPRAQFHAPQETLVAETLGSLGHRDLILSVALSPNGKYALSGSQDKTVRLWDVAGGRVLRVFDGHTEAVQSVAFSPDGKYALSGSEDKSVRLWDVASGDMLHLFEGHAKGVWSVAFSPDGKYALSGSEDRTVRLWDITSGKCAPRVPGTFC